MASGSINILFLGGAKRVEMARNFKRAAKSLGRECCIFSYELDEYAPISCEATIIKGLKWRDKELMQHLASVCREYSIDIVVPFVDGAVAVAAEMSNRGLAFAPTSTAEKAEQMFDKVVSAKLFEEAGVAIPATYTGGDITAPLIAKPRHGSASHGIISIDCPEDLNAINADDYLIQQRIDNRREYTVDCYASVKTGEVLTVCPRIRLEVAGGEVTRTITTDNSAAIEIANKAITSLGLRGAITVQCIEDLDTGKVYLMEINPRLGGGAVCSVAAGADIPKLIISEYLKLPLDKPAWNVGTMISRYPADVIFNNVTL